MSRSNLLEAIGGPEVVLRLAHAWHARVLVDEVVSHAFRHGYHPQHTERLAAYWCEAWGGSASYSASLGKESDVVRLHSGNGEHEGMDQRAIRCFELALDDVPVSDSTLRKVLIDYFTWATRVRMAAYPTSKRGVPEDLKIARWSWNGLQE